MRDRLTWVLIGALLIYIAYASILAQFMKG